MDLFHLRKPRRHADRARAAEGSAGSSRWSRATSPSAGSTWPKAGAIAAEVQGGNRGPELAAFAGGKPRVLTHLNDAFHAGVALGAKESVSFKSPDGTEVQAFVTKPPGFVAGRRYPTILHIHGGPVGQFGWGFDFKPQYFASKGYVVIEPNPRGSTGRGQDFVRGIYQTWGITDYDDLIAAVDYAVAAGYADPDRLAVTGYSYGGYMTNTVITRTGRFKAAATGAGTASSLANYGHDIYQKWYNWELGVPWENREKYDRLSPLLQAGKVTTPTIFLGGRDDWNVPILNAELFLPVAAHSAASTPSSSLYPGMHHGGWTPEFERDYLERVVAWFDKAPGASAHRPRSPPLRRGRCGGGDAGCGAEGQFFARRRSPRIRAPSIYRRLLARAS